MEKLPESVEDTMEEGENTIVAKQVGDGQTAAHSRAFGICQVIAKLSPGQMM